VFEQTDLQRRVAMNGYGNTREISVFSVDMTTPGYALQFPARAFEQPSEIFSGDVFQTAMSKTLSVAEI
jgi:hypothetical protein